MAAFKNKDNGTWYVQFRYTDWKGERQQKLKRGFATKREALEWEREFLMEKQADVNTRFSEAMMHTIFSSSDGLSHPNSSHAYSTARKPTARPPQPWP